MGPVGVVVLVVVVLLFKTLAQDLLSRGGGEGSNPEESFIREVST